MLALASAFQDSWIDRFLDRTSSLSTERWRRWAAITAIGAALEQKVWIRTDLGRLYPILYTILVGPAGAGKSRAVDPMAKIYKEALPEHKLTAASLTTAALVDELDDAKRYITPQNVQFNAMFSVASELSVLLPIYDRDFMGTLQKIYDNEEYSQRRRTKDVQIIIPSPSICILAGTTPEYLHNFLPEGAWMEGFISRTILVYSPPPPRRPIFGGTNPWDLDLFADLIRDLKIIGERFGELRFAKSTETAISDWFVGGGEPSPTHPRLSRYVERRIVHLLKLCMIACVSRNGIRIEDNDFELARAWLEDAEEQMPDIFKSMSSGGDYDIVADLWHYIYTQSLREKNAIHEKRLYAYLIPKTPAYNIERVLDMMVKAGTLKKQIGPSFNSYLPGENP